MAEMTLPGRTMDLTRGGSVGVEVEDVGDLRVGVDGQAGRAAAMARVAELEARHADDRRLGEARQEGGDVVVDERHEEFVDVVVGQPVGRAHRRSAGRGCRQPADRRRRGQSMRVTSPWFW